eukprot:3997267-Alexandrium_andersonii.AAC.1
MRPLPHRLQLWGIRLHVLGDLSQYRWGGWPAVQPPLGLGTPENGPAELWRVHRSPGRSAVHERGM